MGGDDWSKAMGERVWPETQRDTDERHMTDGEGMKEEFLEHECFHRLRDR
jgi:hypothetical protein